MEKIPEIKNHFISRKHRDGGIRFPADNQSLTVQSEKDSCDINKILEKYQKTGLLPEMIKQDPRWGDFSDGNDYRTALDIVRDANEQFAALDAHIRKRFGNDPAEFLEFTNDPKNQEEMIKLGLATEKTPPETTAKGDPRVQKQAAKGGEAEDGKKDS